MSPPPPPWQHFAHSTPPHLLLCLSDASLCNCLFLFEKSISQYLPPDVMGKFSFFPLLHYKGKMIYIWALRPVSLGEEVASVSLFPRIPWPSSIVLLQWLLNLPQTFCMNSARALGEKCQQMALPCLHTPQLFKRETNMYILLLFPV